MAVVINNFDVTAEPQGPAAARSAPPGGSSQPLDADDFISQYATVLREFIRDEIERHLRNLAD